LGHNIYVWVGNIDGWINLEDGRDKEKPHVHRPRSVGVVRSFSKQGELKFRANDGCSKFPKYEGAFGNTPNFTLNRSDH
jgi:hypothetical protein